MGNNGHEFQSEPLDTRADSFLLPKPGSEIHATRRALNLQHRARDNSYGVEHIEDYQLTQNGVNDNTRFIDYITMPGNENLLLAYLLLTDTSPEFRNLVEVKGMTLRESRQLEGRINKLLRAADETTRRDTQIDDHEIDGDIAEIIYKETHPSSVPDFRLSDPRFDGSVYRMGRNLQQLFFGLTPKPDSKDPHPRIYGFRIIYV